MKNNSYTTFVLRIFVLVIGLSSLATQAADIPKWDDKVHGKISGQWRTFYVDRTYTGSAFMNNRNALNTGGWVGYDSPDWRGLGIGAKIYGVTPFEIHDGPRTSSNYDPSLFGSGFESYAYIGELYFNIALQNTGSFLDKTAIKVGRQRLNTPFISADDARILPNLFEAAMVTNKSLPDTTLTLGHVWKEGVGTFANVYRVPGSNRATILSDAALAIHSGYGIGYVEGTNGHFRNMGIIALGNDEALKIAGVTVVSLIYKGIPGLTFQVWDYYAHDFLNTIYLQADYKKTLSVFYDKNITIGLSGQLISQTEVGSITTDAANFLNAATDANFPSDINGFYWGLKLSAAYQDFNVYVAFSGTNEDENTLLGGGIISPWGGMPAFTQGMVTRHQFFPDTTAFKVGTGYNFANLILNQFGARVPVTAAGYYTNFNFASLINGSDITAKEYGFDIIYQATQELQLRLRANYTRNFDQNIDWDEYRLIMNYNF